MAKFDKDIDPYILPLLIHLNKQNIKTYFSCAGHPPKYKDAYLTFKYNKKLIKYLFNNGFRCSGHWNTVDEKQQWYVEANGKLERDKLWAVLSNYSL